MARSRSRFSLAIFFTVAICLVRFSHAAVEQRYARIGTFKPSSGTTYIVLNSGSNLFLAQAEAGLVIGNVSDPQHPQFVARVQTSGIATDLVLSNDTAYVLSFNSGFDILDVSNLTNVTRLGGMALPGARDLSLSGHYLYLTVPTQGVSIIDVADPANPQPVGIYTPASGDIEDIVAIGNYLYVLLSAGLQIVNVSDPSAPALLGHVDFNHASTALKVDGPYAYVIHQAGLTIIDVSNPSTPHQAGNYDFNSGETVSDAVIHGGFVHLLNFLKGIIVLDASNPSTPVIVANISLPNAALWAGSANDNFIYTANAASGADIIQALGPANPQRLGNVSSAIGSFGAFTPLVTTTTTNLLSGPGLTIYDVSNPADPTQLGSSARPRFTAAAFIGDFAYIAEKADGFEVANISNRTNIVLGSRANTTTPAWDIASHGQYLCIAAREAGFRVLDTSASVFAPPIVATRATAADAADAVGITVSSNLAFVSVMDAGIEIYDIATPNAPVKIGSHLTPGAAWGVDIDGHIAYVAAGGSGVQILDITDPTNPVRLGGFPTGNYTWSVAHSGRYLYVADSFAGFKVLDVFDPSNPIQVGENTSISHAVRVSVAAGRVFVGSEAGVAIFDEFTPLTLSFVSFPSVRPPLPELGLLMKSLQPAQRFPAVVLNGLRGTRVTIEESTGLNGWRTATNGILQSGPTPFPISQSSFSNQFFRAFFH